MSHVFLFDAAAGIKSVGILEVSKNIKDGENKTLIYKGNNGSKREAGHHRHNREEKTTMVWPRQKDVRGQNTKINYEMDTTGERERKCVWFPEEGDSCQTNRTDRQMDS
jgi:hypothetical protein